MKKIIIITILCVITFPYLLSEGFYGFEWGSDKNHILANIDAEYRGTIKNQISFNGILGDMPVVMAMTFYENKLVHGSYLFDRLVWDLDKCLNNFIHYNNSLVHKYGGPVDVNFQSNNIKSYRDMILNGQISLQSMMSPEFRTVLSKN